MTIVKKIAAEIIKKKLTKFYSDDFYHLVEPESKGACSTALISLMRRGFVEIVCDKRKPYLYGIADRERLEKFVASTGRNQGGDEFYRALSTEEKRRMQCANRLEAAMSGWRA